MDKETEYKIKKKIEDIENEGHGEIVVKIKTVMFIVY